MKLQHMIVIFLIVMLPLALIMSQYTGLQIDTLLLKTKYDTALLSSTFDTMSAFELNTINSDASSVVGEEIRDLEAVISTFTTSLATNLGMSSASTDTMETYVPAIVFGLYDGYYIYAQKDTGTGRELKPYVYYTKTYTRGSTNITIAYSLDNYVSIYGVYNGKTVSASGYLVVPEDVEISDEFSYVLTPDEERGTIAKVLDPGTKSGGQKSWVKYKGYDICEETIYENQAISNTDGMLLDQPKSTTEAMMYYYEAAKFTKLYNQVIGTLSIADMNALYINSDNDPEDETSLFMNEKMNVMKDSITQNLNKAIYNYEGAVSETYEMPQLTGEDWEKILNNVSITAFLKDIPVGATRYNNYVVVNSSTNQKYNNPKSIEFIEYVNDHTTGLNSYGYYHKITCDELIKEIESGVIQDIIGYPSVDFERFRYAPEDSNDYFYYYKHNEYADYECEVEAIENQNTATIEGYIYEKTADSNTRNKILKAYYSAVGRIRYRLVKASSYINLDEAKTFSVRYYPNGGYWTKGNPEIINTNIGKLQVISDNPNVTGKTFIGWATKPNATVVDVKMGDTIYCEPGKTLDLYAVYANQYTVLYYTNGGTGGPTPNIQTKISGIDYIISSTKPTKADSVFLGWSTNPSATTPEYVGGDIYNQDANLTLYAVWADVTVKITYNSMGGSPVASQEKAVNATITLQGTPVLIGSVFQGWSTRPNGKVEYTPGSQYSGKTDLKLYAIWSAITYRITYDANGGELPSPLQDESNCRKTYGLYYQIQNAKPSREGYEFVGWSRDPNALAPDKNYAPGSWYTENADLTLYAVWEAGKYSIVYDANGGTNTPETQILEKNKDATITNNKPTREGYEFVGWSTSNSASESEVQYRSGEKYTDRTSITLYAVWKQSTYTITYNASGGSPTPASQTKKYGENIRITSIKPTKANSNFAGWSTSVEAKQIDYYPNQVYQENSSVTLYAVWMESLSFYNIYYDANGGQGEPQSAQILKGTNATISMQKPTREGYEFLGWSTNKQATTAQYTPGSTYTAQTDLELYAIWKAKSLSLIIDPNGGTWRSSQTQMTVSTSTYSSEMIEDPIAPTGYVFVEWKVISGNADISMVGESYQVNMHLSDVKLQAQYEKRYYLIEYDKNTEAVVTNMPETQKVQYMEHSNISDKIPLRTDGYVFVQWATSPVGDYGVMNSGEGLSMPSHNLNLYAMWTKQTTGLRPKNRLLALNKLFEKSTTQKYDNNRFMLKNIF